MALNGFNPYVTRPGSFNSPFSSYLAWYQTSTYGPFSQIFFVLAAIFSGFGPTAAIYVFKLFCLLFHVLSASLISELAKQSIHRRVITLAYLTNPILLFEYIKQAHVDAILNFTVVLAIFWIVRKRFVLSNSALLLGVLCKTLPIIWMPLLWVHLFGRRLWTPLAWCFLSSICTFLLLAVTVLPTLTAWISLLNPGVAWQSAGSIHNLLDSALYYSADFLPASISEKSYRVGIPFKAFTYGAYVVFFAWLSARHLRKHRDEAQLILDMGWSALVLFLLATPWYQPWYAAIFVSFTAALAVTHRNTEAMLFGIVASTFCLSSISYYLFAFPNAPLIFLAMVSLCTVIPTLFILLLSWRRRSRLSAIWLSTTH
jgi:alpha-1,6-mannosyltransferase